MNLVRWLKRRLRVLFRRVDVEADLSDEIRLHLDMETEELARQGRSPAEARREARLLLGGVEQTKEAVRDVRPLQWLSGIGLDVRLAIRMLRKSWGLTLVGGLAMVVVIGLCTTIFVLLQTIGGSTLPLEEGDRVVDLNTWDQLTRQPTTSIRDFERWREAMRSVEDITTFQTIERDLTTDNGLTARVSVAQMTASGFRVARVSPLLGRLLFAEDERAGADRVVVIGYNLWQSRFAGDSAALGRSVRVGGMEHVVVGVMPKDFAFPVNHAAWTPFQPNDVPLERVRVFGRLAYGANIETAQAELATIGPAPIEVHDGATQRLLTRLRPYAESFATDPSAFGVIQLLVALLLVPPCANIAILIYARNLTRSEEFAARYVLGASRRRIVGQLLVEASVLAVCAGGVALVLTHRVLEWAQRYADQDLELRNVVPYWMRPSLSFESGLYVAGLALFAALVAGGLPALRATSRIAQTGFQGLGRRTGGPRLSRTWTALVVVQVAVSMAVLPVAADQVWVSLKPAIVGPGFPAEEYLTAQLAMDQQPGNPSEAGGRRRGSHFRDLQRELVRQLKAEKGVFAVTISSAIPEVEPVSMAQTDLAGQERFLAASNVVDDEFFGVFAPRLLTGRGFEPTDFNPGRPAVIINRSFADKLIGGVNPLGLRVREVAAPDSESRPWFEIVGIVDNISTSNLQPTIYHPMPPGQDRNSVSLALRVGSAIPLGLAARLQQIATALDPGLRVDQLRSLDDVYWEAHRDKSIVSLAFAIVVLIVLLFSVAGIYTLAAFAVAQRRHEIAIRAAIGAQPRRLVADIFGRTLFPVIGGAIVGELLSIYIDTLVETKIPVIGLSACGALVMAIGLLAVAGPARRALRIDATEALRES